MRFLQAVSGAPPTWKMLKSSSKWVYFKGLIIGRVTLGGWMGAVDLGDRGYGFGVHSCKSAK